MGEIPLETDDNPKGKLLLVSNHYNEKKLGKSDFCDENDHFSPSLSPYFYSRAQGYRL